jgi:uncharacterized protein (UPF0332 family)
MEAKEFFVLAQELMQGEREVDYRSAASRAYYSAFHACRMLLKNIPNLSGTIGTSHQKVIDELLSHSDKQISSLGNKLKMARDLRQKADYQLGSPFSRHEAFRLLSQVQKILSEIDDYLS